MKHHSKKINGGKFIIANPSSRNDRCKIIITKPSQKIDGGKVIMKHLSKKNNGGKFIITNPSSENDESKLVREHRFFTIYSKKNPPNQKIRGIEI